MQRAPQPGGVGVPRLETAPHGEPAEGDNIREEDNHAGGEQAGAQPSIAVGLVSCHRLAEEKQDGLHDQHEEHRPKELAEERAPLPVDDVALTERRGENQFQRATAAVLDEAATGGQRDPDFHDAVQDKGRHHPVEQVGPVLRVNPEVDEAETTNSTNDQVKNDRLAPGARGDPVEGIESKSTLTEGPAARWIPAIGELPGLFLPAGNFAGRLLPGAWHDQAGQE